MPLSAYLRGCALLAWWHLATVPRTQQPTVGGAPLTGRVEVWTRWSTAADGECSVAVELGAETFGRVSRKVTDALAAHVGATGRVGAALLPQR